MQYDSQLYLVSTIRISKVYFGLGLAVLLLAVGPARANLPGGFTPGVTTPVTTGMEAFGKRTDRYLDNGILHVLIAPNGNVDSIKYLKPGSPSTPAADGIEMVSQFDIGHLNAAAHTQIYYHLALDDTLKGGDFSYFSTVNLGTNIDLGYLRTFNPAKHKVVADMVLHYSLGQGNTALYVYLVINHPARYHVYTNCQMFAIQMVWPTAHDATNYLCEKRYVDHGVKTGLSQNGIPQTRDALEPSYYDALNAMDIDPHGHGAAAVYRMTTGVFSNQLDGKYSYNMDYYKLGTWGRASDKNKVGQWVVTGSHEYINNGATVYDYVGNWGGLYMMVVGSHYNDAGINVSSNANWTKVFGPWALYFNNEENGDACWQDAKNQALAEQQAWPYAWLTARAIYQPRNERATVSGKLMIQDKFRPGASAAGAWVGLATPESSQTPPDNTQFRAGGYQSDNWQFQADGYQYWVQAATDGTFTIPNVQTFSTYGGPATFQLYAFSAGTNRTTGCVGEFSTGPFTFDSGPTNLGTLTWNVPHQGASLAWEIGYPNRTADKFRHGDDYAKPELWLDFANEFSNPLEYTVGVSDWSKDWNYAHCGYWKNGKWSDWRWRIHFNLTNAPASGDATLTLALASANFVAIKIYVNNEDKQLTMIFPAIVGGNALVRQGIHAKYDVERVSIPMSRLHNGANTISLVTTKINGANEFSHVMYDYLSLELPAANGAAAPTPPSSVEARLKKLKEQFDQGLISREIYDQKRQEIMDSL